MADFRTEVTIEPSKHQINYGHSIFLIGSCFSDYMGERLIKAKFNVLINPFGVLYNPVSVANSINYIVQKKQFSEGDIENHNGLWFSYYHHSSFSDPDKIQCLNKINKAIENGYHQLGKASHMFITLGTSWVFERKATGKIVSNCHKIPAREFVRYSISIQETVDILNSLISEIKSFNPNLNIVFTVSPIRHWKDGAVENQRSKSTLIIAISELIKMHNNLIYFPSYEIMMDDLRDYRFYAEDMLHPNGMAVSYIWNKFQTAFMSEETKKNTIEIEKIVKAVNHRPLNYKNPAHQEFIRKTLIKISYLEKKIPGIDLSVDKQLLEHQLF